MAGNGGIIGPNNTITCGQAEKITAITSTGPGTITTEPLTEQIQTLIVAGGGSGGRNMAGGGGAGGVRCLTLCVSGSTPYAAVIGAGGATVTSPPGSGNYGTDTTLTIDVQLILPKVVVQVDQ